VYCDQSVMETVCWKWW